MKFFVEKPIFLKALSHGQSVVEKKTTIPILSHILISAEQDKVRLMATDFDLSLVEEIPAKIDFEGKVCVQAHLLFDIVRKLSERSLIELETNPDSNQLIIKSGRSKFELSYLSADEFPHIASMPHSHKFTLPTRFMREMIQKTEPSICIDESRYNVHGMFMHSIESLGRPFIRAVSTDYHRMSCVELPAPEGGVSIPDIIIGRKALLEIKKLLDIAGEMLTVRLSDSKIEIDFEKDGYVATLASRLVEGNFPDYQSALEFQNDKTLIAPREEFISVVDRVGTVVSDKIRIIKLSLSENQAVFSVISSEFGSAVEEMDVDFPYETPIELCVNVKYLLDAAQIIEEDEIEFLVDHAQASIVIRGLNNKSAVFILMPLGV
ncbi:MAG: Beta sliding clamp [Holosporales bacterium]